jgi:membrane protease YdiL (CAAX protease family)
VLAGFAVASDGTIPWALLGAANERWLVSIPWAVAPMLIYLWFLWRYLRGEGRPRVTASARRESLRANPVSGDVWALALFAGMLGFAALMPFVIVLGRLVRLPAESQPIVVPAHMPFVTVFLLLVMASVVAGVVEESAFRGYMQGPIERRHGAVVALLLNGVLFGLLHFTHHPTSVFAMLPYYLAITGIFGGIAWATNSIMPGIVLHAMGDVFSLTRLWATGQPEWQQTAPTPLIWESGPDAAFWGALIALILLGGAAIWAIVSVAQSRDVPASLALERRPG